MGWRIRNVERITTGINDIVKLGNRVCLNHHLIISVTEDMRGEEHETKMKVIRHTCC